MGNYDTYYYSEEPIKGKNCAAAYCMATVPVVVHCSSTRLVDIIGKVI